MDDAEDFVCVDLPATVGFSSIIGETTLGKATVRLGRLARIGRFCFIEHDVVAGDRLELDDHCGIYSGVRIGSNVKLLYGKKIYRNSVIGDHCIIGGHVPERCTLGPRVTFMGEVAHAHRDASLDWDTTDEPSPTIGEGSVVGLNSILIGVTCIGRNCYVGAGEILRHNLPDDHAFLKGVAQPISRFRGFIKTRYIP